MQKNRGTLLAETCVASAAFVGGWGERTVRDCCLMHGAEKKGGAAARGSLLAETCVGSAAFVSGLHEKALAEARCAAEEALKQRKASQGGASTSSAGWLQPHPPTGRPAGCWCAHVWGIDCYSPAYPSLRYMYMPLISIACRFMGWHPGQLDGSLLQAGLDFAGTLCSG